MCVCVCVCACYVCVHVTRVCMCECVSESPMNTISSPVVPQECDGVNIIPMGRMGSVRVRKREGDTTVRRSVTG